jgi:hypothetical protein
MSLTKQYPFIIIILISIETYLCQEQYLKLSNDENNNTSSFNETLTAGKLLNSLYTRVEMMHLFFLHLHTFLSKSSTRILYVHFLLCSYR